MDIAKRRLPGWRGTASVNRTVSREKRAGSRRNKRSRRG